MKTKIQNYTFDKTAKTVTFNDYADIRLDCILAVVNVTTQDIIYNPSDHATGGTVLTNVLTLEHDTSAMANTDKLLIFYDENLALLPVGASTEATLSLIKAKTDNLDTAISGIKTGTDKIITSALSEADFDSKIGGLTETAPSTDTGSSAINGRMQRIAQRLTSLIAFFSPVLRSTSTAYEAGRVASASAATFLGISGYNSKTAAQFIQIHNASSAPADTSVPIEVIYVPAMSSFAFESLSVAGDSYSTGIYVCNSSTGPTKTIGLADCWFNVRYR